MKSDAKDPSRTILLRIAYKGTAFHGYQTQENADSVEAHLNHAIATIVDHPVKLRASSRTDAGVHALDLPVAFTTASEIGVRGVVLGANRNLPADIRVIDAQEFSESIDPRRRSEGKVYRYHFWNAPITSPLLSEYTWQISTPLDLSLAQRALSDLCGKHDFAAFQASGCSAEHAVRRITKATLTRTEKSPNLIALEIHGEAFVRHQVRIISGTILEICLGRRDPNSMRELLKPAERKEAGQTAPAQGLLLVKVDLQQPAPIERWPKESIDSTALFPVLCG